MDQIEYIVITYYMDYAGREDKYYKFERKEDLDDWLEDQNELDNVLIYKVSKEYRPKRVKAYLVKAK